MAERGVVMAITEITSSPAQKKCHRVALTARRGIERNRRFSGIEVAGIFETCAELSSTASAERRALTKTG